MKMRPINQALCGLAILAVAIQFRPGLIVARSDAKHVVIVEESSERTAKQAMVYVTLQQGAEAKRRAAKGCVLEIIDRDDTDESGNRVIPPSDYEGLTLPAIVFYSKRDGKLLYRQSLGREFTAEAVVRICKGHGA